LTARMAFAGAVLATTLVARWGLAFGPADPGTLRKILAGDAAYEGLPEDLEAVIAPPAPPPLPAEEAGDAAATGPELAGPAATSDEDGLPDDADKDAPPATTTGGGAEGPTASPHSGSLSLGYTALGSLERAAELPARGEGFALLPMVRGRGTQFATDELVGLLQRAAAGVRETYPRAVLRIGNASYRRGGKFQWSVSHRAGRDVDLAFFVDDPRGRPLEVQSYEHFGRDGRAAGNRERRFSVPRNWALVEALVMDTETPVQRIFVADWLRTRLLEHAHQSGADPQAILRAELVLAQPRDSSPHADHFHVRIYCSRDDRLEGCHNFGPVWPWVDPHDGAVERRLAELTRDLRRGDVDRKLEALRLIARLEAHSRATDVGRALGDASPRVRDAALDCLTALRSPEVGPALLAALRHADDPAWATRLLSELQGQRARGLTALLERILRDVPSALPHLAATSDDQRAALQAEAARTLGFRGRPRVVPLLIQHLAAADPALRVAAAEALSYLTNHDLGGRWTRGVPAARLAKQQERWQRWYDQNQKSSQAQWIRLGFQKKGIRFKGRMVSRQSIPQLIRAMRRGGYLAHNASRILAQIVGQAPAVQCDANAACWDAWWRSHHREYGHRTAAL